MDETRAARLRALADVSLAAWGLDGAPLELIATGENTVYRVDAPDGRRYALRIHRPGYHTLAELESELVWTTALDAAGVGTPRAVRTRAGTGYTTVAFSDSGDTRHIGLVEWIEGELLGDFIEAAERQDVANERFRQLGALIARLHEQATAWTPPRGFVRHALDADGLMGDTPFWGPFWALPQLDARGGALAREAKRALHRALVDYGKDPRTYSLIHADLHPCNVLVHDGHLTVIDFDDAGFGWHVYDLAVALFNYQGHPAYASMRDALLAGYRSVRALADADVAQLPTFLLIRAWAVLGWILGRPELDRSAALPRLIARACEQTKRFLSRGVGL
jgi:Ser/Thr protein kinase RdoA (MazF antagonist)